MTANQAERNAWGWIWWVVFPPYAIYRFIRFNPLKWYVKVPVVLVLLFTIVLAIDLAVHPHRVEEAEAKEAIAIFMKQEVNTETIQKTDRLGEGVAVSEKGSQRFVYYQALTDSGLYQFAIATKDGKKLSVDHAEQLYPIRVDIKGSDAYTKAEIAIWLSENEERVGKPKKLLKTEENGLVQTIQTDKGTYEFKVGNQNVYEVNRIDKMENLVKLENQPRLPERALKYIEKNEEKVGELDRVLAYEMDASKEMYYFRTTKGEFLWLEYVDGRIDLEIGKEKKE